MQKNKTIEVNLETGFSEDYKELIPLQGELKQYEDIEGKKRLIKSILSEGIIFPTFVWRDNEEKYIWDGHGRSDIYKELDEKGFIIPQIPVVYILAKNITDAKIKLLKKEQDYRRRITSDGLADFMLDSGIEVPSLKGLNLPGLGELNADFLSDFQEESSGAKKEKEEKEDEVPDEPIETNIKNGDIFQLGEHRIMCGDSTNINDIEQLMNNEKADMVFTDPPYGMNLDTENISIENKNSKYKFTKKKYSKIIGDDEPFDAQQILPFFDYCKEIFLWGADYYLETICRTVENLGSWIVWDKHPSDKNSKRIGASFELCWSKAKHQRNIARIQQPFGSQAKDRVHPTQKPVELAEWFFKQWAKDKKLIVDLFLGSGSTLIACEKTNRKCYGMEIYPIYCDVTIKRWEDYTGKKAEKIN